MWIIIDLLVVAVVLLYIFLGTKRGFARGFIEVVGFFAALYLAFFISTPVANFTYDHLIGPSIEHKTEATMEKLNYPTITADVIWQSLPKFVTNSAENKGIQRDKINAELTEKVNQYQNDRNKTVAATVETVVKPVILPLIKTIIAGVLFIVLIILVKILARLVGTVAKLPVIHKIDGFLGGISGLFKGLLIAVILCIIISTVVEYSKNGLLIFTKENVQNTVIFKYFSTVLNSVFKK